MAGFMEIMSQAIIREFSDCHFFRFGSLAAGFEISLVKPIKTKKKTSPVKCSTFPLPSIANFMD